MKNTISVIERTVSACVISTTIGNKDSSVQRIAWKELHHDFCKAGENSIKQEKIQEKLLAFHLFQLQKEFKNSFNNFVM